MQKTVKSKSYLALFLAVLMMFGCFGTFTSLASTSSASTDAVGSANDEILANFDAQSYFEYLEGCIKDGAKKGTAESIVVDILNYTSEGENADNPVVLGSAHDSLAHLEDASEIVYLPEIGSVTFSLDISPEDAGLYGIRIEYYPLVGSTSSVEKMLFIDEDVPFAQARSLSFSKSWTYTYMTDDNGEPILDEHGNPTFKTDKAGNSIRPEIAQDPVWRTYECRDTNGFYNGSFEFYFTEGEHTLTLKGVRESMAIKSIVLFPVEKEATLDEQYKAWKDAGYQDITGEDAQVKIEAETPSSVSDSSVIASNDRTSAITSPSNPEVQLINTIGKNGYKTVGQWANYDFTVDKDGIYQIGMRYKQTALEGMFVNRVIKLWSSDGMYGLADGTPTVPYEEAYYARFEYNKDWQSAFLSNGEKDFKFCFKEGVDYTISFEVGLGDMATILDSIENSLKVINESYLTIIKLTGSDPDEYRDYNFNRVMPATIRNLREQAVLLQNEADKLVEITGTKGSNIATLESVSRLLEKMGNDEEEIAPNLSQLKSYIGTLGTWINNAKSQGLLVDCITVQGANTELPKDNANFFEAVWFELSSFISSFFVDYNAMGVTDEVDYVNTVSVWLAYGRDQSLIWKSLIDNNFTSKTGIAVELKLVVQPTLLPSVLAGRGPDAYIGLPAADTLNYAIRGAIMNVEGMDGFNEVLGYDHFKKVTDGVYEYFDENGNLIPANDISFNAACMVPLTLYGKSYGLPEQAALTMMFYRMDILADLGIDVPETWDDVLASLPVLQANNMEIGLAYEGAIKMFLYQYGGSVWKYEDDIEYAGAQIGWDTELALESFTFCSRLYTDYSFPTYFDGPNRFRTGEMPILIADYVATYNQLVVFATEIKNLWSFTALPGVVRDDGTVNNQTVAAVTATIMLTGCKDVASTWEYMKWQATGEMQAQYGNEMVALVGPAAKYPSANIQGIKNLSWTANEYAALLDQFQNMAAIPNYPGSYIIDRYTKFAFLAAFNEGEDPVDAMEGYIATINQELTRKRIEFDLKILTAGQTPESVRAEENK